MAVTLRNGKRTSIPPIHIPTEVGKYERTTAQKKETAKDTKGKYYRRSKDTNTKEKPSPDLIMGSKDTLVTASLPPQHEIKGSTKREKPAPTTKG